MLLVTEVLINTANKLPPANDLTQKSLQALQRYLPRLSGRQGALYDIAGGDQAKVQYRTEHTMKERFRALTDGIFIRPKHRQALIKKVVEPRQGLLAGHRPSEAIHRPGMRRKHLADLTSHLGDHPVLMR